METNRNGKVLTYNFGEARGCMNLEYVVSFRLAIDVVYITFSGTGGNSTRIISFEEVEHAEEAYNLLEEAFVRYNEN